MSNLDKNILITPGVGSSTDDPKIVFSAANTTANAQNITMRAYPTANGTLSVEGSAGQLFSITNQLTGTIFSVNDISGIPSIQVQDTGQIQLAPYGGYVTLNANVASNSNTTGALQVLGGVGVRGNVYADAVYSGNVLLSTALSSNVTYISGIDTAQNTRMTIIEGTDVGQNARMTIIEGTDVSQNARMTIIEGVDATQNTNIANKLNLTGSLNQTVSGNVTIGQDLIVSGNLIITGNISSQNVQQLAVADPLIILGIGNYVSDTKDIGFAGHYNDGTNAHAGLIRDSGTKEFYIFKGYTPELDSNNNVIITDPSFTTANLNASYVKANLITYGTNYLQVAGNTTGNTPTISAQGSDNDVGLNINVKGLGTTNFISANGTTLKILSPVVTNSPFLQVGIPATTVMRFGPAGVAVAEMRYLAPSFHTFWTNSSADGLNEGYAQLRINSNGLTTNYLQVTGAPTGNSPIVSSQGSDTNVSMSLLPKGTGALNFASANVNLVSGNTSISNIVITNNGGNYTSIPTGTISPPTTAGGVQATFTFSMFMGNFTIANGGTGYTNGDVLTIVGGTFSSVASLTVSSNTGGVITGLTISSYGSYTALPTNPVSVTGGTGVGATFTIAWGVREAFPSPTITNPGSGYVEQPTITFSGGGGSGTTAVASIGTGTTIKSLGQNLTLQGYGNTRFMLFDGGVAPLAGNPAPEYLYVQNTAYSRMQMLASGSTNAQLWLGSTGTGVMNFSTRGTSLVTQFRIADPGSVSVNYLQVSGNTTGNAPTLSTQGSDANVNMNIVSSGNTSIIQGANNFITFGGMPGNEIVRIYKNNTIAGGYLQAGFSAPAFSFLPPQSNFGAAVPNLGLNPRVQMLGQDGYFFSTNYAEGYPGASQFKIAHNNYGSSLNWLTASGGATGNSTTMSTQGSDTNVSMSFLPKGTGAFNISTANGVNLSSNTGVTGITMTNRPGGTWSTTVTVSISPPTTAGGVTATANLQSGASTVSIVSGGTGYNIGDIITLSGGVIAVSPATVVVTGNSTGGVVTSVTVPTAGAPSNQGYYWSVPTGTISTTTNGSGVGATFTANWYCVSSGVITNAGSGYVEPPTLTFAGPPNTTGYAFVGSNPTIRTLGAQLNFVTPVGGTGFAVTDYTSSGNYWTVYGSSGAPYLFVSGSTPNIDGAIASKGTGSLRLTTNGGVNQLVVSHTASSVNYINITGAATGPSYANGPTISVQGSDTDMGMAIYVKNNGILRLLANTTTFSGSNNGGNILQLNNLTSNANYVSLSNAPTGQAPFLQTQGSDANVNFVIDAKGTGQTRFYSGDYNGGATYAQLFVGGVTGAVNYLQMVGATTGNTVIISSQGSDANVSMQLQAKGNGAVLLTNTLTSAQKFNQGTGLLQVAGGVGVAGNTVSQNFYVQGNNNLITYSQDFSQTLSWSNTNTTFIIANTTAPDGTFTGTFLQEDATNNNHYAARGPTGTTPQVLGQPYTFSIFAKANQRNIIWLQGSAGVPVSYPKSYFNLLTGVVTNVGQGHTPTITSVGNGWYRCSITFIADIVNTSFFAFGLGNALGSGSYTGDGASGLYIWGAQVEFGYVPSPYTLTTAVTIQNTNNLYVPSGNIVVMGTQSSYSTANNALTVNTSIGVANSIYVGNRVGFANSNNISVIYQSYNPSTNSLDVVFG